MNHKTTHDLAGLDKKLIMQDELLFSARKAEKDYKKGRLKLRITELFLSERLTVI